MAFKPLPYQAFMFNKSNICGICDIVNVPKKITTVQFKSLPREVINENFDSNNIAFPLDKISPTQSEVYKYFFNSWPINPEEWLNSISFTHNNQPYLYALKLNDVLASPYIETIEGDIHIVEILKDTTSIANTLTNIAFAVNDLMTLPFGVTATISLATISYNNLPINTQIDYLTTITTPLTGITQPKTWGLNNFMPLEKKVCFINHSLFGGAALGTTTPSIFKNGIINPNKKVRIKFLVENNTGHAVDATIEVKNAGFVNVSSYTQQIPIGQTEVEHIWNSPGVVLPFYIFNFGITDPLLMDEYTGLCILSASVLEFDLIENIEIKDCDGVVTNLPFSETYFNNNVNLTFDLSDNGQHQIIITDNGGNTYTSNIFNAIDDIESCKYNDSIKLKWYQNCFFSDTDYKNLPFENEVYIKGYIRRASLDKKERISFFMPNGEIKNVFNHSVVKNEVKIGLYSENFYEVLERAFEHQAIFINGNQQSIDDGSILSISAIGNGYYIGRIELIEVGKSVVNKFCCP